MMPHEDSELLEYETEQPEQDEMTPIPVYACEPVTTVATVPQHTTCRTIVLTSAAPVTQLLPNDPLRARAVLTVADNDIVLCHSLSQAQAPANVTSNLPNPDGTLVPSALTAPVELDGTGPLWVAAAAYPARIGLVIERRGA